MANHLPMINIGPTCNSKHALLSSEPRKMGDVVSKSINLYLGLVRCVIAEQIIVTDIIKY